MDANENPQSFSLSAANNMASISSGDENTNAVDPSFVIPPSQFDEDQNQEDNSTSSDHLGKFNTHYVSSLV